jgi:hypothetical protein
MTPRLGFCLVFSIVFAIGALSLAAIARAESGMEWQFFQTNDPGNKSTRLIYGVPETDNLQVSGACVHSSSIGANFSIVTFGADIGDLENGKDTQLRVSGGGFDHALKGKIFRATGEEGLSGVQVDIGNDDPLWRVFAEKESLDYLVPGYKAASLDLTRGRDKIQQFSRLARLSLVRLRRRLALPRAEAATPRRRLSRAPRNSARSRRGRRSSPMIRPGSAPIWRAPISRSLGRTSPPRRRRHRQASTL